MPSSTKPASSSISPQRKIDDKSKLSLSPNKQGNLSMSKEKSSMPTNNFSMSKDETLLKKKTENENTNKLSLSNKAPSSIKKPDTTKPSG